MTKIDPYFADELKKYGAKDFDTCFNCGNCSAVCSHSEKTVSFPRMTLRLGILGLKKEILSSVEPWLCYSCGDCTETCPRQAGPGQYLAAVRRYAISEYEPTGLTRLMFKSPPAFVVITMLIAVFLGSFLFTLKPDQEVARWIFNWLPYNVIHNMGLVIFSFTGLSIVWGVLSMIIHFNLIKDKKAKSKVGFFKAVWMVISEAGTMDWYKDCDAEEDSHWRGKPWYSQPWFVHWSIMWGFIGLLGATSLDFILKDPATTIWWPSRILGTIAGLLMIFGTSQAINYRLKKVTLIYSETSPADWTFLWFLWIAGITGFWLEVSVAFGADNLFNQFVFLVHTIISMELVLLFAFSKFAHAVYRPIALFYHYRNQ
ncbi:MAG: 4Fe-4S dicluster domain-containing protein [Bacteroidota bacterium]